MKKHILSAGTILFAAVTVFAQGADNSVLQQLAGRLPSSDQKVVVSTGVPSEEMTFGPYGKAGDKNRESGIMILKDALPAGDMLDLIAEKNKGDDDKTVTVKEINGKKAVVVFDRDDNETETTIAESPTTLIYTKIKGRSQPAISSGTTFGQKYQTELAQKDLVLFSVERNDKRSDNIRETKQEVFSAKGIKFTLRVTWKCTDAAAAEKSIIRELRDELDDRHEAALLGKALKAVKISGSDTVTMEVTQLDNRACCKLMDAVPDEDKD